MHVNTADTGKKLAVDMRWTLPHNGVPDATVCYAGAIYAHERPNRFGRKAYIIISGCCNIVQQGKEGMLVLSISILTIGRVVLQPEFQSRLCYQPHPPQNPHHLRLMTCQCCQHFASWLLGQNWLQ